MSILPTLSVHLSVFLLESSAGVARTIVYVATKTIQLSPRASTISLKLASMPTMWIAREPSQG